ncbi:MAG: hypothetical protein IPP66_13625 [Anaerolineales bacterium]|nr:hypothetical protein [Anaerolineales bacterium]
MDTTRRTTKSISSRQMASSEIQKRIIKLGENLVKALGLDSSVDTLSRWMAHYIAEQMSIAKKAKGKEKIRAEQQCFETILKLWQHRSHLPAGVRPFESFDPILRALERFDPDNKQPYFYRSQGSSKKNKSGKKKLDDVQMWLDIAQGIDQAARIWLEYVFHQAALNATDRKTVTWLENAVVDSGGDEVSIIVRLIDAGLEDIEDADVQEQKARQDKLKSRIEQLDSFNNFSQTLRAMFVDELSAISQVDSSVDTIDSEPN